MENFEHIIASVVYALKFAAELLGALTIGLGLLVIVLHATRTWWHTHTRNYRWTRMQLSQYLVLGLEFQLAADILGTSIAPNWTDLGKLAVIATIRTALNFFLQKETEEMQRELPAATSA